MSWLRRESCYMMLFANYRKNVASTRNPIMVKKSLVWWSIVFIECCFIVGFGYRLYQNTIMNRPKKISVLPIEKDTLHFPQDTHLQFYSEPKANIQKLEDGTAVGTTKSIVHTFNSDGLNERYDYSVEKGDSVFRIVTLGDSFTEGAFIDTKDNYSEVLEDMLNAQLSCPSISRFEVINLGVEGYDMQYVLERFKRKGIKYHPDLVILWTHENDYTESNEKLGRLAQEFDPFDQAPEKVTEYTNRGDFYPALTVLIEEYFNRNNREELIDEEMKYLQELTRVYAGSMLIFTLERFPEEMRTKMEQIMQSDARIGFYPKIPDTYAAFPDQHPSTIGHKQFADFLFAILFHDYISKCN